MAGRKITVFAPVKAKPGMEEAVEEELLALVGPTRTERSSGEGCFIVQR